MLLVLPTSGCLILFLRIQVLKLLCSVTGLVFPHVLKECNTFLKCRGGGSKKNEEMDPTNLEDEDKMSVYGNPVTQHHVSEDLNPHQDQFGSHKSHVVVFNP